MSSELFQRQLAIPIPAKLAMNQVGRVAEALRVAVRAHAYLSV